MATPRVKNRAEGGLPFSPHRIICKQQFGMLSLDVAVKFKNEIIVISGNNGAGKTTLLRAIAGLEKVSGMLHIQGQTWLDSSSGIELPTAKRNIAYMWSEPMLLPWLNVNDNIKLGSDNNPILLAKIYTECNIHHLQYRFPTKLSTGEAQRVALARAIYSKPCLLLLDEPLSAQAPASRHKLRTFLHTIQQQWNIPMLIISHDVDDEKMLAEQHWQMLAGRIVVAEDHLQ